MAKRKTKKSVSTHADMDAGILNIYGIKKFGDGVEFKSNKSIEKLVKRNKKGRGYKEPKAVLIIPEFELDNEQFFISGLSEPDFIVDTKNVKKLISDVVENPSDFFVRRKRGKTPDDYMDAKIISLAVKFIY